MFDDLIHRFNDLSTRLGTVGPYLSGFISTDAFDDRAQAEMSLLMPLSSKLNFLGVRLTAWIGALDAEALIQASEVAKAHSYLVRRSRKEAQHLMGEPSEELLSALSSSSGRAWAKLHGDLSSRTTIRKTLPGRDEAEYPLTELRNLQSDGDPDVRKAAYEAELELLTQNVVAYAAAMNSIKGQVNETTQRRGWDTALDEALFSSHITKKSLEAMQSACRKQFSGFPALLKG